MKTNIIFNRYFNFRKRINSKYLLVFTFSLIFVSCSLDEKIKSFRTENDIFATPGSTAAALNSLLTRGFNNFNYYQATFPQRVVAHSTVYHIGGGPQTYDLFDIPTTDPGASGHWDQIYAGISSANITLESSPEIPVTDNEKLAVGLALFIRSFHYLNGVRIFGGMPLVLSTEAENVPRSTRDEVFEQVVQDFELAYEYLPATQANLQYPKKMAAAACLAVAYHHWASLTNDMDRWKKALDWAKIVINSNAYSLLSDFSHLWDLQHEFSNESIFEIAFTRGINGSAFPLYYNHYGNSGFAARSQNGGLVVNLGFADKLLATYGGNTDYRMRVQSNIKDIYYWPPPQTNTAKVSYPYTNADLGATRQANPLNLAVVNRYTLERSLFLKKYSDPNSAGGGGHENNAIILRYSEVLLIAAEAEAVVNGGPNSIAVGYLNQVLTRARNGVNTAEPKNVTADNFANFEEFRDRLLIERGIEFMGELPIWMDERRFGLDHFRKVVMEHNVQWAKEKAGVSWSSLYLAGPNNNYELPTSDALLIKNMLWPIPQNEIINNQSILDSDQNPGY